MRPAQEVMAELAASGLSAEQIALVIELSAAVATEARPIVDEAAVRRREKDREYQYQKRLAHRNNRQSRQKSADIDDPPKEEIKPPSSVPDGTGGEPPDPVKELFDVGVGVLTASGMSEKQARSFVGKLRKGHGDGDVLAALTDCRTKAITNPVEWLPKRLGQTGPPSFIEHYRGELSRTATG